MMAKGGGRMWIGYYGSCTYPVIQCQGSPLMLSHVLFLSFSYTCMYTLSLILNSECGIQMRYPIHVCSVASCLVSKSIHVHGSILLFSSRSSAPPVFNKSSLSIAYLSYLGCFTILPEDCVFDRAAIMDCLI